MLLEMNHAKNNGLSILHSCCIGNKFSVEKCTYTLYICPIEIQMYTINFQSHIPRKYNVLKGNFMFDVGDISQEHNRGVK
jgi:hypothetical protein